MKKILLSLTLASLLFAKSEYTNLYQLHSCVYSKSIDIKNASQKEIFFGTKKEYYQFVEKGLKEIKLKGLEGALNGAYSQSANLAKGFLSAAGKGIAAGAAIGGVIGMIDSYIKDSKKAAEYMYLAEFTTADGKTTYGTVLLSSQKKGFKEDPDMDNIKKIMKGGF